MSKISNKNNNNNSEREMDIKGEYQIKTKLGCKNIFEIVEQYLFYKRMNLEFIKACNK